MPAGSTVEAGIRPEHFVIGEATDAMAIKVDVVEPTGSETHVYGAIGADTVRAVFRDRVQVKPGEMLPVSVASRQHPSVRHGDGPAAMKQRHENENLRRYEDDNPA